VFPVSRFDVALSFRHALFPFRDAGNRLRGVEFRFRNVGKPFHGVEFWFPGVKFPFRDAPERFPGVEFSFRDVEFLEKIVLGRVKNTFFGKKRMKIIHWDDGTIWGDLGYVQAKPAKWKYRSICRVGDQHVGQWSAEVSVTIGG
jgi:hypothetical protein